MYDQTKDKRTLWSCTIYTILNMLRYDFCVKIEDSLILKLVAYMEKIWKLLPKWADFNIIYPAVVGLINLRYWIKLKIEKSSISKGLDDDNSWSLWVKGFSSKWLKRWTDDWLMSKDDIDWILWNIKTGSWHNHMIKKRKNSDTRMILDSWGWVKYEIKLEDLKYAMQKWLYYDTARRIVAEDEKTKLVKFRCYTLYSKLWRELTEEEFKKVIY
mgnify:CR=1 FL=1